MSDKKIRQGPKFESIDKDLIASRITERETDPKIAEFLETLSTSQRKELSEVLWVLGIQVNKAVKDIEFESSKKGCTGLQAQAGGAVVGVEAAVANFQRLDVS